MGTATKGTHALFATVMQAEQAFHEALTRADIDALMRVWSDDEEIICIQPGNGRLVGRQQIRQSWQEILQYGGLMIERTRTVTVQTATSATHCSVECVRVRTQHGMQQAWCDVTQIFHKGPSGWRLVVHHASPSDIQGDRYNVQEPSGLLH